VLCHRFIVFYSGHVLKIIGEQNADRDLISETLRKLVRNSIIILSVYVQGRDCVISIATRHGLDFPGIESQWGSKFSAPVHTGPGAHAASYTMGTRFFPGVKRSYVGVDHPPPPSIEVKE